MNNKTPSDNISLSKFDEFAKNMIFKKLSLITQGSVVIFENDDKHHFGLNNEPLIAEIYVHHRKFYSEIAFGGSIGAAEAYILGYWSTNDLTSVVRV